MGRVGTRRPGEVELTDHFPGLDGPPWPPYLLPEQLAGAGLVIEEYREQLQRTHFLDIGALAYYLTNVAWAIPGFTVDGYRDRLRELHVHIGSEGRLTIAGTAILARAVKPQFGR
jgi:hypothetical protein